MHFQLQPFMLLSDAVVVFPNKTLMYALGNILLTIQTKPQQRLTGTILTDGTKQLAVGKLYIS